MTAPARLRYAAFLAVALAAPVRADGFGVTPLRADLDPSSRSAILTVINDGDVPGTYQAQLSRWTQESAGQDAYASSNELIYFPQQLRIPAKERRIVRIGLRGAPPDVEQAYRLYIEELAAPKAAGDGAQGTSGGIGVSLRFGVPVFVRPAQPRVAGDIAGLEVAKARIGASVRNTGNVHFRIRQVLISGADATGAQTFTQAVDGWYLLAGAMRSYAIALPREVCEKTTRVRFEVKAEELGFDAAATVNAAACS